MGYVIEVYLCYLENVYKFLKPLSRNVFISVKQTVRSDFHPLIEFFNIFHFISLSDYTTVIWAIIGVITDTLMIG